MKLFCGVRNRHVEVTPGGICVEADEMCQECSRRLKEK